MALKFHSDRVIGFDLAYEMEYNDNTLDQADDAKLAKWLESFGCPVHVEIVDRDCLDLSRCDITGLIRETVKVKVYERS